MLSDRSLAAAAAAGAGGGVAAVVVVLLTRVQIQMGLAGEAHTDALLVHGCQSLAKSVNPYLVMSLYLHGKLINLTLEANLVFSECCAQSNPRVWPRPCKWQLLLQWNKM
jgi:hypothetical protein